MWYTIRVNFKKLKQQNNRPIVALVLGSGGARGYAHIGVIQSFRTTRHTSRFLLLVPVLEVLLVQFMPLGKSADELRDIALNMKPADVREIRLDKKGVLDGKKVEELCQYASRSCPFEKLKIPMYVVATELQEGHKVVF